MPLRGFADFCFSFFALRGFKGLHDDTRFRVRQKVFHLTQSHSSRHFIFGRREKSKICLFGYDNIHARVPQLACQVEPRRAQSLASNAHRLSRTGSLKHKRHLDSLFLLAVLGVGVGRSLLEDI